MKKFLLSLVVLFASVATAQTYYQAGETVTEVWENQPFLLSCNPDCSRFLTNDGSKYLTSELPTGDALVEFEYAYEAKDGTFFYYIKFSESGMYIADQEMRDGMDSSDMRYMKLPFITLTEDVDKAVKWSIMPAETRMKAEVGTDDFIENWRVWTGKGDGSGEYAVPFENAMVIMRDALSTANPSKGTSGGQNAVYLEVQNGVAIDGYYAFFAPWGANSWFVSYPEEMDEEALLYYWVDANFPDGIDGLLETVGTRAGVYTPESVEALEAAFEAFYLYDSEYEGDPAEILAALIAGKEALVLNEVEEGYYYLTSDRGSYVAYDNNGGITGKAGFVIPTEGEGEAAVPSVTVESSRYLWYFNPVAGKERTFTIKNFGTGMYASTSDYNTQLKTAAEGAEYIFEFLEGEYGIVYIYHKNDAGTEDCAWNIFSGWAGTPVGSWSGRGDQGCWWHLTPVAEDKVKAIEPEVVQHQLNSRLKTLLEEATASYSLGRFYKPDADCTADDNFTSHGYLTYEKDEVGNAVYDEAGFLVSNLKVVANDGADAIHYGDGLATLGALDGAANTYIHTKWSGTTYPHFFEIDLGEGKSLDAITVKFMRRMSNDVYNGCFTSGEMIVFGRNSLEEEWMQCSNMSITYDINVMERDDEGNVIVNEETGEPTVWKEKGVGIGSTALGAKYRYLRLQHYKTCHPQIRGSEASKNTYFSAAEVALFGAAYDESKSLNTAVPANILAAFEAEMTKAKAELETGKATEAQILALQTAYNEYLANFPEPKRLTDALAAAKSLAETLPVDDAEVGYYPQAAYDAYNAVIAEVEATVADVMTLATINEGVAKLDAAKTELLKSINMFTSGFYQIKIGGGSYEEALLHSSRVAADTKEVKGLRAEFAKQTGNVDEGFVDDENYITSVASVWYLEVGENNKVAIRSLGNGLYLQPCLANSNNLTGKPYVQLATSKTYFEVQADGLVNGGMYNIILGADTASVTKGRPLYANIFSSSSMQNGHLVSWHAATGEDNSTFKFEAVDLADFNYGVNYVPVTAGENQFMTFPYDTKFYAQMAKVYELAGYYAADEERAIYFTPVAVGSTLTAGTPYLIKPEAGVNFFKTEFEQKTISESDFNYSYESKSVNGLTSTIFSTEIDSDFGVIGYIGDIVATEDNTIVEPYSAYIDGSTLPVLDEVPTGDCLKILSSFDFNISVEPSPEPEPEPEFTCVLTDGTAYTATVSKHAAEITYTRTLPNLYWNALYIPFEVPYESISDKYNVAYINAIRSYDHDEDGALDDLEMEVVKIKAGTLKANYPYLIQAKTEADRNVSISVSDATLYAAKENSIDCSTVYQKYEVTGTYNVKTAAQLAGKLAISIDGAWQPLLAGSQLNPYRLYLSITNRNDSPVKVSPAALSRVRIVEKGQYTGIDSVDSAPAENVFYDLSGRRVMQPVKGGVYIQNGKKVIR